MTTSSKSRRPRFTRRNPPPLRPTDDDRAMVALLLEHRFLRSTHFVDLLQRPKDKIVRRLAALYHNGYVDRPRAQIDLFTRAGSSPLIYAPGSKASHLFGAPDNLDWTKKNRTARQPYLEHTLLVADFMVALECALRDLRGVRLIRAAEIEEDFRLKHGRDLRSWTMTASISHAVSVSSAPDKVFALEFAETGRRNYFLVEADRSTMPISRRSLGQSSFKKKLLAYHHGHAAKRHHELWGIPGFRVLTITRSAARIESMIAAVKEITGGKGSNVFVFGDVATVLANSPLAAMWRSGKGMELRIMDPGRHTGGSH